MRIAAVFVLLIGFTITSCHKDCKTDSPVVTISTPAEAGTIQLPDSVSITGTITDDVWLNDAVVMIHNANEDTVFISRPDVYGKKAYAFAYTFYTNTSGTFHLHVAATDNEGQEAEKEIVFTVQP